VSSVDDGTPEFSASELEVLKDLVERGALEPVIDRRYALEEIVEAHRYVQQEHKKGNVVIAITERARETRHASRARLHAVSLRIT